MQRERNEASTDDSTIYDIQCGLASEMWNWSVATRANWCHVRNVSELYEIDVHWYHIIWQEYFSFFLVFAHRMRFHVMHVLYSRNFSLYFYFTIYHLQIAFNFTRNSLHTNTFNTIIVVHFYLHHQMLRLLITLEKRLPYLSIYLTRNKVSWKYASETEYASDYTNHKIALRICSLHEKFMTWSRNRLLWIR